MRDLCLMALFDSSAVFSAPKPIRRRADNMFREKKKKRKE